jgi:hypothetical protein
MSVLKEYLNLQQSGYQAIHDCNIDLPPRSMPAGHLLHEAVKQLTINIMADIDRDSSNMDTCNITATHHGDPETCTIPL